MVKEVPPGSLPGGAIKANGPVWCARLPITRPGSIVVLLQAFGGDNSPPLWHMALPSEGCQCQRRGVVLHSPRVLRESLPVLSKDSSGNAAPSVVEKAAPGIRARHNVLKESCFVVCATSLNAAR